MPKIPSWLLALALLLPQTARASAIYCCWDEQKGEFLVVADTRVRCFDFKSDRTVKYEITQKWAELPNGALFVATGKYVENAATRQNILALAREAVTKDMTFEQAADAISATNIKYGLLAIRNDRFNLFEGCLVGFDHGTPKMTYLRFPPKTLLAPGAPPYAQWNRLPDRAFPLGAGEIKLPGRDLFANRDKKSFLVESMRRQIRLAPTAIGAPIDVLTVRPGRNLEYQRVN